MRLYYYYDPENYANQDSASPEILVVKMADRLCNTMDFVNAGNAYCRKYLRYGECLFGRVAEKKFHTQVEQTIADGKVACSKVG